MKNFIFIFTLTFSMFALENHAKAGVIDNKTPANNNSAPQDSHQSDMSNNFNLPALEIDLKAVQKAFISSKNSANIKTFYYDENQIAKISLRVGMRSLLHFDKNEVISSYIVGNSKVFKVQGIPDKSSESGIIPNILTIKSLYSGADTNLTVLTESQRVYTFYLRSYSVKSKEMPALTIYMKLLNGDFYSPIKNFASQKKNPAKSVYFSSNRDKNKSTVDYLASIQSDGKANTNYRIYGDKLIAPYAVYDDGAFTYFDYRHNLTSDRLPVVYKVIDGFDTIVNFRVEKGFLIAESLSPEGWTLINGQKTICVKPSLGLDKAHPKPPRTQFKSGGV